MYKYIKKKYVKEKNIKMIKNIKTKNKNKQKIQKKTQKLFFF
jgi:hypothetical protein